MKESHDYETVHIHGFASDAPQLLAQNNVLVVSVDLRHSCSY